jgi:hypothetical protein
MNNFDKIIEEIERRIKQRPYRKNTELLMLIEEYKSIK